MTVQWTNNTTSRPNRKLTESALSVLLSLHNRPNASVSIVLVDNPAIQKLNKQHRGQNEATDVLSFPAPPNPLELLGDVVISVDFAKLGARANKHTLSDEIAILAVHGTLHCLGFDDQTEADYATMKLEMNRALKPAGINFNDSWMSQPHGGANAPS